MELVEKICKAALSVVDAGQSRIVASALHGISCEGWLKIELIEALALDPGLTISPELNNVDIVIDTPGKRVYLELKTFPTNYRSDRTKPITNFVHSVCKDLKSLRERRKQDEIGLVIWIAYIVPSPEPIQWPGHVAKIEAYSAETILMEQIPLWQDDFFANLYIMRSY